MSSLAITVPGCKGGAEGDGGSTDSGSDSGGGSSSWVGKCTYFKGNTETEYTLYYTSDSATFGEEMCESYGDGHLWSEDTSSSSTSCGAEKACLREGDSCVCRKGSTLSTFDDDCIDPATIRDSCD